MLWYKIGNIAAYSVTDLFNITKYSGLKKCQLYNLIELTVIVDNDYNVYFDQINPNPKLDDTDEKLADLKEDIMYSNINI
jgi:hypothetical protein